MIIGGGVAGMTAAQILNNHGILVHLIEKKSRLGGHASTWACMANDTCQQCSACAIDEMADTISRTPGINKHLSTQISSIEKKKKKYITGLKGTQFQTNKTNKINMANGLTTIKPNGHIETSTHQKKNKINTFPNNHTLTTEKPMAFLPQTA